MLKFLKEKILIKSNSKTQDKNLKMLKKIVHTTSKPEPHPQADKQWMDPAQLRKTVESFHALSNANEKTVKKLNSKVKKAERHYAEVKKDRLQHTTNPLVKDAIQVKDWPLVSDLPRNK